MRSPLAKHVCDDRSDSVRVTCFSLSDVYVLAWNESAREHKAHLDEARWCQMSLLEQWCCGMGNSFAAGVLLKQRSPRRCVYAPNLGLRNVHTSFLVLSPDNSVQVLQVYQSWVKTFTHPFLGNQQLAVVCVRVARVCACACVYVRTSILGPGNWRLTAMN